MIHDLLEDSDLDSETMGAAASREEDKESRTRAIRTKVKAIAAFNPLPSSGRKNKLKAKNKQIEEKVVESPSKEPGLFEILKTTLEDRIESWDKLQKGFGGDKLEKTPPDSDGRPISPRSESAEDNPHCMLCGQVTTGETLQCRVCDRKYHRKCLTESGMFTDPEMDFFDRAATPLGWSCLRCDNIFNLLTPSELDELSEDFDRLGSHKDASSISLEEFLDHGRRLYAQEGDRSMTEDDERFERIQFKLLDADGGGTIEYGEFLKHVACLKLSARPKEELVELLTRRELLNARHVFGALERDADGHVTARDARLAFRSWYVVIFAGLEDGDVPPDTVTDPGNPRASLILHVDDDTERAQEWREFLEQRAICLISSRPNTVGALSEKEG